MSTRRSGATSGSGLNSSVSTMVKSAVLKPIPIASDATATSVKAVLLRSHRREKRMSARNDSNKSVNYSPRLAGQCTRRKRLSFRSCSARGIVHRGTPMPRTPTVKVKRVYEPPSADDGVRILVDRLWPRGLTKAGAAVDLWLKDIA